ncbi:MAG: hypothetical protein AAB581_03380 [Patescibacteria group bacterium]
MENKFFQTGEDPKADRYINAIKEIMRSIGVTITSVSFNPKTKQAEINGIVFQVPFPLSEIKEKLLKKGGEKE